METNVVELQIRHAARPTAIGRARRDVEDALSSTDVEPRVSGDLMLLVSELVTNAVRHAGTGEDATVVLEAVSSPHGLRISVTDPGPGFEPQRPPAPRPQGGGAGLVLVDRLASRWAVEPGPPTVVWFELDDEPASAAA
jgi:anti-sigma regulatory factor (Ser/Thr protein kinase)